MANDTREWDTQCARESGSGSGNEPRARSESRTGRREPRAESGEPGEREEGISEAGSLAAIRLFLCKHKSF